MDNFELAKTENNVLWANHYALLALIERLDAAEQRLQSDEKPVGHPYSCSCRGCIRYWARKINNPVSRR